MVLVHGQYGFFLNWNGDQAGEGIQFHLLALTVALVLTVKGCGARSLDRVLAGNPIDETNEVAREPERLRAA
jgi:putative oxidoreductase